MILEILKTYWREIAIAIFAICEIIILLVKKNKIVQKDTAFEQLLRRLPTMIRSAENSLVNGDEKLLTVCTAAITFLVDFTGLSASEVKEKYLSRIKEAIEDILSTPTKKGVDL